MGLTFKKVAKEGLRPFKQFVDLFNKEKQRKHRLYLKGAPTYNEDWLVTCHNTAWQQDPSFIAAYQRGIQATGEDYRFRWRVHVALWAASQAVKLDGAFVECGVNRGFLSSAIMAYLNWNSLDRSFFLFDTFKGLDLSLVSQVEKETGRSASYYSECYEDVRRNFSEFKNVFMIRGSVPSTLPSANIEKVAYLSIDMNCCAPEIAAAEYFWPKLVKGGLILLDDYNYVGFNSQNEAFNTFAKEKGINILSLPTGQGLIIKS